LSLNGRVAASHFCYLLSELCPFGSYAKKSSKLVLIGSSHQQEFAKFAHTSAIQATEIYEFARSLQPRSTFAPLDHLVKYKLIYAARLLEHGMLAEACKYVQVVSMAVNARPSVHSDKVQSFLT
jgi:hypothetical protein